MRRTLLLAFLILSNTLIAQNLKELTALIDQNYFVLDTLYKHFHKYPELSGQEKETSKIIAFELKRLGYEVTENFGGYGVVGIFKNGKGPVIMLRTDMDALPIEEKTGLSYSGCTKGKNSDGTEVPIMQACGHDVHMTVFLGNAKILVEMKNKWKGTLMLIAQPAEEISNGAKGMIQKGLFEKFGKPDYAIALHVSAALEAGLIGYCPGPITASVDKMDITVYGVGGHGAYPHTTIDPVVLASRMILDFQTIISREKSPLEPAVLTVGSIHGGTRHNIIPDEVKLQLTIRTYNDSVRNQIVAAINRICKGIAMSAGLPEQKYPKVILADASNPSTINDEGLTEKLVKSFKLTIGNEYVLRVGPEMAGEDFARYGRTNENVPICLYWLGTVQHEKYQKSITDKVSLPPLHSPYFSPDVEKTLKTGIKCMTMAVIDLFNQKK